MRALGFADSLTARADRRPACGCFRTCRSSLARDCLLRRCEPATTADSTPHPPIAFSLKTTRGSFTPQPLCAFDHDSGRGWAAHQCGGHALSARLHGPWRAGCAALPMWAQLTLPASELGWCAEDELAVGQCVTAIPTANSQSREAEALVQSRLGSLPGMILRPSIIVGDSRTGVTSSFKMMYWPLQDSLRAQAVAPRYLAIPMRFSTLCRSILWPASVGAPGIR